MRTDDEILARVDELKDGDWMRFETFDLLTRLPFKKAQPFIQPGFNESEWAILPRDKEALVARMREYMPFAWAKANEGRGLSASRSMSHFSAWLWLAEIDLGDMNQYQFYGKDNLCKICAHFGWDAKEWDDGVRTND